MSMANVNAHHDEGPPMIYQDLYNNNSIEPQEGCEWRDIKSILEEKKQQLADGEIVLDRGYNYFGVISVIEIGDKTMDVNLGNEKVSTFEEQRDAVDLSVSDEETLLRIMDNYLRVEATWHSGRFLHQTVLTSQYLALRESITNTPLKLFMEASANTLIETIAMMESSEVCDTEEFFPALKGAPIGNIVSKSTLIKQLKEEEKRLLENKSPLHKQLASRLTFRRILLETNALIEVGSIQSITKAQTLYHQLFSVVTQMEHTSEENDTLFGHSKTIRKLANSSHPIPEIPIFSWDDTVSHFKRLAADLEFVCKAKERRDDILLLLEFSKLLLKMNTSVLVRNIFMLMVFRDDKIFHTNTLSELTRSYVRHCPTLTATHKRMISTPGEYVDVDNWVHNIGICFIFSIQAFSMNAGRAPRRLKMLLREWNSIVQKGAELDYIAYTENKKNQPNLDYYTPFASYVQDVVISFMHDYLTINHSLGLYDENEYPYIFYYLHYLNVTRWSARSSFNFISTYEAIANQSDAKKKKKKKKNKSIIRLKHELLIHMNYHIARSMSFFICGLFNQDMMKTREFTYGSELACFESRMGVFADVSIPGYLDYTTYKKQSQQLKNLPLESLYSTAKQHFSEASFIVNRLLTQLKDTLLPIEAEQLQQYKKTIINNQTVATIALNQSKNKNATRFVVNFENPASGAEYPFAKLVKTNQ